MSFSGTVLSVVNLMSPFLTMEPAGSVTVPCTLAFCANVVAVQRSATAARPLAALRSEEWMVFILSFFRLGNVFVGMIQILVATALL